VALLLRRKYFFSKLISSLSPLAANDTQVLVLTAQPNGVLTIIEATKNITASNATRVENLELAVCHDASTPSVDLSADRIFLLI
jgi:hypothetical protein